MAKKTLSVKMCEVVSDMQHLTLDKIKSVIGSQSCIDKYLYILHDKDVKPDGTKKNPHYHVYLHFTNARQFEFIAKWFGVPMSFVSKIHGRFADAVSYAIHHNSPEKYQYDISECTANFEISEQIQKSDDRKKDKIQLENLLERIDSGEIKQYNITSIISMPVYIKYETQINRAFEYKRKQKMKEINRNMKVIYIYGTSGLGKTTLAKMLAIKNGLTPFISSSSNDPFDGYEGQEAIILDDLRGSSFPFADLLKILDMHTASTVKARYKNVMLQSDTIYITSIKPPKEFYRSVFESEGEEYTQFVRRCESIVEMTLNSLNIFVFDYNNKQLVQVATVPNPVAKLYQAKCFDKAQRHKDALDMFSFADSDLTAVAKIEDTKEDFVDWSQYELLSGEE